MRVLEDLGRQIPTSMYTDMQRSYQALIMSLFSYDVDLPVDCDDEYWEHPDPEQAFKQPPGKPSKISFLKVFMKLLHILAFAQRNLVSLQSRTLSPCSDQISLPTVRNQEIRLSMDGLCPSSC